MWKSIRSVLSSLSARRELLSALPTINECAKGLDANALVELVMSEEWNRFFWIKQVRSEIKELCNIVEKQKPRVIVEIGTANGGSLFLFSKLASADAIIVSIDLPSGKFGGGYPEHRTPFYHGFKLDDQRLHLLRADSHNPSTINELTDILGSNKIDFLFIDGDHTYEGVKRDFIMYSQLVSPMGIIALHDVAQHGETSECKVNLLWNELKTKHHTCFEIIEDKNQKWAGIGIVYPPFKGCGPNFFG